MHFDGSTSTDLTYKGCTLEIESDSLADNLLDVSQFQSSKVEDAQVQLTQRIYFPELMLLTTNLGSSLNKYEISRLILQFKDKLTEGCIPIGLYFPIQPDEFLKILVADTNEVLWQFPLTYLVCLEKCQDTGSTKYLYLTHRVLLDGDLNSEYQTSETLILDNGSSTSTSVVSGSDSGQKSYYKSHIIQCSSVFEANRIVDLARKIKFITSTSCSSFIKSLQKQIATVRLFVDVRERDPQSTGTYNSVPKEKSNLFKLRKGSDKRICIGLSQPDGFVSLCLDKFLDVCLGYGRFLPEGELTYLGSDENAVRDDVAANLIPGTSLASYFNWPTKHPNFHMFNMISSRNSCIFFTVIVHLLLSKLDKPLRLRRICRARIYKQDEIFWLALDKKPIIEDYKVHLIEYIDHTGTLHAGKFVDITDVVPVSKDQTFIDISMPSRVTNDELDINGDEEDEEDDDEPLVSGNGLVTKEIPDDQLLVDWGQIIKEWHARMKQDLTSGNFSVSNPYDPEHEKKLYGGCCGPAVSYLGYSLTQRIRRLVNRGIPDALRAEVWQLLAGCPGGETGLMNAFRILITKSSKHDEAIQRDLARTFPAHTFFRERIGQESLFQVSRAYSLYDEEVGYYQGLSFFAAVLLLHMPVEQAFILLVQINRQYGVRDLFLHDCAGLHMRLYQLERLVQDQLPDLAKYFAHLSLETHMYASQWFLTLFTAKFPLAIVFHIMDLFLTEGMIFIFKVSLCLLRLARRDLLGLDFEGVLRYLRVTMPKRYLSPESSHELLTAAITTKISPAKLRKYAKEWDLKASQEKLAESPTAALERQVVALRAQVLKLEEENFALVSGKTTMHQQVDQLEDKAEILARELFASKQDYEDAMEEKSHLETEVAQVKNMFRTALEKNAAELEKHRVQLNCYKTITIDLYRQLVDLQSDKEKGPSGIIDFGITRKLIELVSKCHRCTPKLDAYLNKYVQNCEDKIRFEQEVSRLLEEKTETISNNSGDSDGTSDNENDKSIDEDDENEDEATNKSILTHSAKKWLSTTLKSSFKSLKLARYPV